MSAPRYGDRVRVVIEGEAYPNDGGKHFNVYNGAHGYVGSFQIDRSGVTVEKIEPPVETFQPGDIVRAKVSPSCVYALSDKGYTYLQDRRGLFADYRKSAFRPEDFTSEDFEKVAFAEVPF